MSWGTSGFDRYMTPQEIAKGDKTEVQFLEYLRAIAEAPYKRKRGQSLTWERGWAWEALLFIDKELNAPRAPRKCQHRNAVLLNAVEHLWCPDCGALRVIVSGKYRPWKQPTNSKP